MAQPRTQILTLSLVPRSTASAPIREPHECLNPKPMCLRQIGSDNHANQKVAGIVGMKPISAVVGRIELIRTA